MLKKQNKEMLSVAGLLAVAFVWGLGFPALKALSDTMPAFFIIAARFILASLLLGIVFRKRLRRIDRRLATSALILSAFLFFTYVFATVGIRYTTSAKASFFSCIGVVFIPIIGRLLFKVRITGRIAISVAVCAVGLFLISYTPGMGFSLALGDILCMLCSLCGAFHVIYVGRLAKNQDAALLTLLQLFFIAVFAAVASLLVDDVPSSFGTSDLWLLLFLGIFCTAIAFLIQTASQKYISSSRVGVIFAVEPVSGAAFSAILLGDHLGIAGIAGGLLIVASIIIMETGLSSS